jgi:hypothetical protein
MIHYHGGRHSTQELALRIWKGRHALVSHADPQQIAIAAEATQSFALDNGAFSAWKQNLIPNWTAYYDWVGEWCEHPGFDWAVIPDVIDGNETENDWLISQWPFPHRWIGVPVWHMHESVERLMRLCAEWPRVALGSSGQYKTPGTHRWWQRINVALSEICPGGRPICRLHGLRMLRPEIFRHLPLASADSAGVSRGTGTANWGGAYKQASDLVKALVLIESYESTNSAAEWRGIPEQGELLT